MQTERVTFLTTREHKAALDAYAATTGRSVGNVVREATARYIAQPPELTADDNAALNLLADELEAAIPKWNAKFDSMETSIDHARNAIRDALALVEATK
jgi:hypothetical protein